MSKASPPSLTSAEANRLFYAEEAMTYEQSEDCLRSERQQKPFREALAEAVAILPPEPLVLDACGGTGNVGEALHAHGIQPVVVDVSAEMLELWRAKVERRGGDAEIHLATIEDFFASDHRRWDLITFSSALHHLEDYMGVFATAASHLAPGGCLFTSFDPTPATRGGHLLRRIDFVVWLGLNDRRRFTRLVKAKVGRGVRRQVDREHIGRMAERHAYVGVDDGALVAAARGMGMDVLVHHRYGDARLAVIRWLLDKLHQPSNFRLLVRAGTEGLRV